MVTISIESDIQIKLFNDIMVKIHYRDTLNYFFLR